MQMLGSSLNWSLAPSLQKELPSKGAVIHSSSLPVSYIISSCNANRNGFDQQARGLMPKTLDILAQKGQFHLSAELQAKLASRGFTEIISKSANGEREISLYHSICLLPPKTFSVQIFWNLHFLRKQNRKALLSSFHFYLTRRLIEIYIEITSLYMEILCLLCSCYFWVCGLNTSLCGNCVGSLTSPSNFTCVLRKYINNS